MISSGYACPVSPARERGRRRPLAALLAAQALAVGAVLAWGLTNPLAPDDGLQQLDALTLVDRVEGVDALGGRPTIYLAPGDLDDPECAAELGEFLERRTDPGYPAVLLLTAGPVPETRTTVVRDAARLVRALALEDAVTGCRPGYALVNGDGVVRYRTYDPGYGSHGQEQRVLLDSLR